MALTVSDILDSPEPTQPVRLMSYGPIEGEHTRATNYGPQGNQLGPYDVAVSPDTGFHYGDILNVGDGVYRRAADASYFTPGRPTSHTIELRDKHDQGSGLAKRVTVNDILGPEQQRPQAPNIPSPTLSQEVGPPAPVPQPTPAPWSPPELKKVLQGADLAAIPKDAAMSLMPFLEAPKAFKQAYDVLRGVPPAEAVPESQRFVGIENKPLQQRVETGLDTAINLLFAKQIGESLGAPKTEAQPPPLPKAAKPEPAAAPPSPVQSALADAIAAELDKAQAARGKPFEQPRVSPETGQVFYPEVEPVIKGETARIGATKPLDEIAQSATLPSAETPEAPLRPEKEPALGAQTSLAPAGPLDEMPVERQDNTPLRESASMARSREQEASIAAGQGAENESLGVTGVSRAARDAAGEVDRTPAAILSVEDHVQNGQALEAGGADTDALVKDAVNSKSFSRDATDLAIKRDADLTLAARQARRAADQAPGDTKLAAAADAAERAQQQWEDYAIRPIRGQFADTGMSLQTAIDLDTGDYVDYAKQFRKQNGREPTQPEAVQLQQATRTARKLSEANSRDLAKVEKAAKPKRIMNLEELRQSLAKTRDEALKPCPV